MNSDKLVSIIIANFNGEQYLNDCLFSIGKTEYSNYEVIIADDGSTDASCEVVRKYTAIDSRIKLLQNQHKGAAASRNKAALQAKGEILIFLDNDTQVTPRWVRELIDTLYSAPNIGGAQSVLFDFQKRDKLQNAGVKLWAATGWGLPLKFDPETNSETENIIAISASLAVRKDVFIKVGGFDEQEAVVTEDLDLSWRIWLLGYRVVRSQKSIVFHWTKPIEMRKNLNHNAQKIYFHLTKNSLTSILKNYQLLNAIKFVILSLVISFGRSFLVAIKRKDFSSFKATIQALVWVIKNSSYINEQRSRIQHTRKSDDAYLMNKVIIDENLFKVYKNYFVQTNLL